MLTCCLRLKEAMDGFSPTEQQIAAYIIKYPGELVNMSIDELAEACSTSVSSVVRLCKSANYSGYKEFLRVLSADLAVEQDKAIYYDEIQPGSPVSAIVKSIGLSNAQAIENTISVLDVREMEKAVDAIAKANRIDFYGCGTSSLVAMDAHNKFVRINKFGMDGVDPHQHILTAALLRKGDVAVLISYSGDTKDIVEVADIVKSTGATLISITRCGKNELSQRADIQLFCSSSESLIRSGAMGSRIGSLTIIDIMYTAVASKLYADVKPFLDKTQLVCAKKHLKISLD